MSQDRIAGRYRLERAVGQGGMGIVWLGVDEVLQRQVALKRIGVLPGESADDRRRALREARTAAALNHRHAVSVFDVVDHDGATWIVMEYWESRTLAEVMKDGPLPVERAARIGAQAAQALAAAHAVGVIHRDVKPGNILLGEGDETKISDFGIAQPIRDERLTRTGLVSGTPSYFSPELARGAEPGPASDVWALGATLYAAVEGRPPHQPRQNALATLQVIAHEPVPPPARAGLLAEPLARMLDREPETRWTMAEAATGLQALTRRVGATTVLAAAPTRRSPLPAAAPPPAAPAAAATPAAAPAAAATPTAAPPVTAEPPARRSRVFPVALAVAAVLLVVIGTLVALSLRDPEAPATGSGDDTSESAGQDVSPDAEGSSGADDQSPAPDESEDTDDETQPSEETQPTEESQPSETQPTEESAGSPPGTATAPTETVDTYFETVPGDLDAGWAMLASPMQQRVGRDAYDGFWATIADVDATNIRETGEDTVTARITYTRADGSSSVEDQTFTLVPTDQGGYLIASDR